MIYGLILIFHLISCSIMPPSDSDKSIYADMETLQDGNTVLNMLLGSNKDKLKLSITTG